jgi:RNA polymerase sigma-70 factor (ECF subfamily)
MTTNFSFVEKLKEGIPESSQSDLIKQHLLPHVEVIFRCACRLSRKVHDAEDLTQETFYFAIKNFNQLKDHDKAKNWLFSILKNLFLKDIEKNKKKVDIHFDSVSNSLSAKTNLENDYLVLEARKAVREGLGKLDDRLKRPIEMFYYERLSYKEIADKLELPIGTVMSRIARGKVYLKRELDGKGSFEGLIY